MNVVVVATDAKGLSLMQNYPEHKGDMAEINGYKDLTEFPVFSKSKMVNIDE